MWEKVEKRWGLLPGWEKAEKSWKEVRRVGKEVREELTRWCYGVSQLTFGRSQWNRCIKDERWSLQAARNLVFFRWTYISDQRQVGSLARRVRASSLQRGILLEMRTQWTDVSRWLCHLAVHALQSYFVQWNCCINCWLMLIVCIALDVLQLTVEVGRSQWNRCIKDERWRLQAARNLMLFG